jgi:hypothetical protein
MSKAEEFIQNYTRNCSNEIIGGGWVNGEFVQIFNPWLTPDQARKAVEIAREEVIEEAVKWLNGNIADYFGHSPVYSYVEDFRKYMEDKV